MSSRNSSTTIQKYVMKFSCTSVQHGRRRDDLKDLTFSGNCTKRNVGAVIIYLIVQTIENSMYVHTSSYYILYLFIYLFLCLFIYQLRHLYWQAHCNSFTPITTGPLPKLHVNFPRGKKPQYPKKTYDFRQSVDFTLFTRGLGSNHTEKFPLRLEPETLEVEKTSALTTSPRFIIFRMYQRIVNDTTLSPRFVPADQNLTNTNNVG